MTSTTLTEQLARWLVSQRDLGFSDDDLQIAQNYVLDWLGSALAGGATVPGKILCDYARGERAGHYRIVGTGHCSSAEGAALANGGLSHILEMDDLDRISVLHPGAVVIPAALAMAEQRGSTGRELLSAVIAGYEIAIRIGEAVGKRHYYYFHNTATCGIFGSAAAAGWLMGLDEQQLVWALGNAGTQAAGLWQFNLEGAMSKHLHAGMAAANGMRAASLAALDFSGSRSILEGKQGFFAATSPDANPKLVVKDLGVCQSKIRNVSIKPHASCRHTHPAIDAALAIRNRLANGEIKHCQVDTYSAALDLCDNPDPQTAYSAKFSLQYCVSSALARGRVGLVDFSPESISDSDVRQLQSRTSVALDPDFEQGYPIQWAARVSITLDDGKLIQETVFNPRGDPENPLSAAELEAKFRQLATFGGHAAYAGAWLTWIESILAISRSNYPPISAILTLVLTLVLS